jgi:hypothetical protein
MRAASETDMSTDRDWDLSRNERNWRIEDAGMGALRVALLFGSAMVAIALLLTPLLDQRDSVAVNGAAGIDVMSTGSIGTKRSYTIRRSVLQDSPASVCIIRSNGARSGDC